MKRYILSVFILLLLADTVSSTIVNITSSADIYNIQWQVGASQSLLNIPSYWDESIGWSSKPLWNPILFTYADALDDPGWMYVMAVKDAEIASPEEISKNLTAIIESNSNLIWDDLDTDQTRVMVVTWTGDFYNDKVGESIMVDRYVWVTAAPELRNFCTNYQTEYPNLTVRLKQLLGLPPDSVKSSFVEIWVYPYDLFRPSPDPEITDHEAELTFPESKFFNVSDEYINWFNEQKAGSYGQDGYPWTRLGYTYDWGNPDSEVGLSEFVINKGSIIEVNGSYSIRDYCLQGT